MLCGRGLARATLDSVHWSNILVRASNWLGDAVMSVPALRALRAAQPEARIALLARPWVADLYRTEPFADELLLLPPSFRGRVALALKLRSRGFDAAILLPNSFESALIAKLAGATRRIGYDRDGRGFLLTDAIPRPKPGEIPSHERFYYLELLRRAQIIDALPPEEPMVLAGAEEARTAGERLLARMGVRAPVVGVSPGTQNSRAKQWFPDRFAEAAALVTSTLGGSVMLFGSAQERSLCQAIAARVRQAGAPVLSVAGETPLAQFIELAAACRVFLTNDSGAMHVASALGVPTVAVFGPTEWFATSPCGPISRIVREPVECSPCMLRDCPIDHRCMRRVTVEQVASAALEFVRPVADPTAKLVK